MNIAREDFGEKDDTGCTISTQPEVKSRTSKDETVKRKIIDQLLKYSLISKKYVTRIVNTRDLSFLDSRFSNNSNSRIRIVRTSPFLFSNIKDMSTQSHQIYIFT